VAPDKTTWYDTKLIGYTFEPHRGIWALGSGSEIAIGAMAAGASAVDACGLACEFDAGSGLPIVAVGVWK
jgi:ATP-dependent protease HslVU (ClpYQ) peptidase subunit